MNDESTPFTDEGEVTLTLRLPERMHANLLKMAEEEHRSINSMVLGLIHDHIADWLTFNDEHPDIADGR